MIGDEPVTSFEAHILVLAEKHPELPVKAAVEYARALMMGNPIPLPDPTDAPQIAAWALRMPAVMAHVEGRKALHAIRSMRQAGGEWGVHIETGVAQHAYEILLGEQEEQCDTPRCNQVRGHQGACLYKISNLISNLDRSSITGPQEPRLIDVLRAESAGDPDS